MVENTVLSCYTSVTRGCFAQSTFTTVPTLWMEHLVQIICVALDLQLCRWWNSWFVLEIMDCSSVTLKKWYLNALLPSDPLSSNLRFIALVEESQLKSLKPRSRSLRVCLQKKERIETTLSSQNGCPSGFFLLNQHVDQIWHKAHTRRRTPMIQMSPNHHQSCVVTHKRLASLQGCHRNLSIFYWSDTMLPPDTNFASNTYKARGMKEVSTLWWKWWQTNTERPHLVLSSFLRGCLKFTHLRSLTLWFSGYSSQQHVPEFSCSPWSVVYVCVYVLFASLFSLLSKDMQCLNSVKHEHRSVTH